MNQSQHENTPREEPLSRRRSRLHIVLVSTCLVSLGAVLGVLLTTSTSAFAGFGSHWRSHGHGHGHGNGPVSLEYIQERTSDRLDWVLGALDASDEQAGQLKAIGTELVTDLYPVKQQHGVNKREIMAQLRGTNPDPVVLENLRRKEMELADIASARVLDAVLKGSDVLTQEQRDKLSQHFRHGRH